MTRANKPADAESTTSVNDTPDEVDIEALLTAIVTPALTQLQNKLMSEINRRHDELKANIDTRFEESSDKPSSKGDVSDESDNPVVKALQAKIASQEAKITSLEAKDAKRAADQEKAELDSAFKDAVASGNPEDFSLALAGLQQFAGQLSKVDGQFISSTGKDLKTVAAEFYASPSGKRTLPSGILTAPTPPPNGLDAPHDEASLDDRLSRSIAGI